MALIVFLCLIVVVHFHYGSGLEDEYIFLEPDDLQQIGYHQDPADMYVADSLSISKHWASRYDQDAQHNPRDFITSSKQLDVETILTSMAENLNIAPPQTVPGNGVLTSPVPPTLHYTLRGTRAPGSRTRNKVELPVPSEPSFSLQLEVTTSKSKIVGFITTPTKTQSSIVKDQLIIDPSNNVPHPTKVQHPRPSQLEVSQSPDHRYHPKLVLFASKQLHKNQKQV